MTAEKFMYRRVEYGRGRYPHGHHVRCKHCGRLFEEHAKIDLFSRAQVKRKGFTTPLVLCAGYEPGNLKKWHRFERRHQEDEHWRFRMAWYERQAQGQAAWALYGAQMRAQQFSRDRTELEQKVAKARSPSERKEAEGKLGEFLRSRRGGGMLVVGSGAGGLIED